MSAMHHTSVPFSALELLLHMHVHHTIQRQYATNIAKCVLLQ